VELDETNVKAAADWHCNEAGGHVGFEFWQKWILLNSTVGVFAFDPISGENLGFGGLIPYLNGFRFSPLYAKNFHVAKAIILELINRRAKAVFVYFSVPSCNAKMLEFVTGFDFELVHQLDRSFSLNDQTQCPFPDIIYSIGPL